MPLDQLPEPVAEAPGAQDPRREDPTAGGAPPPLPSRASGAAASAHRPHFRDGRVLLVDYDPKWPYLYQREADRIREALGEAALAVEHVGSTSVPGLAAKPCVDVLLVVADPADEDSYAPRLEAAGYALRHREPDFHEHRLFNGPDVNVNLHVFGAGSPEVGRMLMFRDRLRSDDADRALYQRTKLALAERAWREVQDYADAKSEVVEEILGRARAAAGRA
ncbi:GrpB family protein [Streptomonospora nanhaiensis]|uniref:GrpB-like predicted nucleotidyltransferase (UPF0157 family) n=1 Tax=Streptomonospora nanhaiensis TaxID=1323731 RepID=A0A853BPZ1_9ACTN|nr:GrpB family protein [Streptomonospora nanhaiensis]MBV2363907.1 GrpB family protein [Streptomonospora nanhaiensis]MBX9388726.1 GrpB family protein [Streptomonospora nanhaiensis]NYI96785.1 GrpB-like predicted nucleotidyltransferase (UPF0157 family) [Streptomonospora nanhaiensis]